MRYFYLATTLILTLFGCKAKDEVAEVYRSDNLIITRLTEKAFVHESYLQTEEYGTVSCNGVIFTANRQAVVIDTPTNDTASRELIEWAEKYLDSKITAVVPTHYHADNLGGLAEFHRQDIPSYALQKTIEIATQKGSPQPQNVFDNTLELRVRDQPVRIGFYGAGHTIDNVFAYFPSEKILFGGCLVKAIGSGKGNLEEADTTAWPETVRRVQMAYPDVKIVIPGHGSYGGAELLQYTIDLFQ